MEQESALLLCPLLPVIHCDYAPDPSTSTENLVLGHPPAIPFLCWCWSHLGEISLAMEKPEREAVSLALFLIHCYRPLGPSLPSVYTLQMALEYGTEK